MRKDIVIGLLCALLLLISASYLGKNKDYKQLLRDNIKLNKEYLVLMNAKQQIDTLYIKGETKYVHKTNFKAITDTFLVERQDTFRTYIDTLKTPEIDLKAKIIAKDLHSIDYEYNVTEKVIYERSIVNDTIYQTRYKSSLNAIWGGSKGYFETGIMYQNKKQWGIGVKSCWFEGKQFYAVGLSYRIF